MRDEARVGAVALASLTHFLDQWPKCRDEFRQGCEYLNHVLPSDEKLNNVDRLLDLLDFDKSNSIEVNEFFEVRAHGLCMS